MILKSVLVDGIDFTRFAIYPVKDKETLDESLDQSTLTLSFVDREMPFDRLADVAIGIEDDYGQTKTIYRVIANDKVEEVIVGNGKAWTHTLILIELTKLMEREFVDTKTFTNALDVGREFDYVSRPVTGSVQTTLYSTIKKRPVRYWPFWKGTKRYKKIGTFSQNAPTIEQYKTPIQEGTNVVFKNPWDFFRDDYKLIGTVKHLYMKIGRNSKLKYQSPESSHENITFAVDEGEWVVQYYVDTPAVQGVSNIFYNKTIVQYKFSVVQSAKALKVPPAYTIADVVDVLCQSVRTLYEGEMPDFSLDDTQRNWLSGVKAPEFAFTKMTLWEAMLTVGGYIHAIPRLLPGKIIHFDKLGQNDKFEINEKYYIKNYAADIENYCTDLDTNVDNMIFNDDENIVSIVDPDPQMARTTRATTEEYRITEDNCLIWTILPIYEVNHLWICDVNVSLTNTPEYQTFDLKPYLYENAEYQALSSYGGSYPWSKNYALYYTQGTRNVQGLNLRNQDTVIEAFKHYAIYNILSTITGVSAEILSNHNNLTNMLFRVEYVPLISARLKQRKPVWNKTKKSVLAYNQTENTVSGNHYGEKIKGAIAKLGNIEKTLTFATNKLSNIPPTGALIEGKYYVMDVSVEYLPEYMNVTCTLCEDYNKISEYIGLLSNRRYYEVSEKQSVDRQIIMEDICLISHEVDYSLNDNSQLSGGALFPKFLAQAFMGQVLHQVINEQDVRVDAGETVDIRNYGTFVDGDLYCIDWGDGSGLQKLTTYTHTYSKAGQFWIKWGDGFETTNVTSVAFEPIGYYGIDIEGVLTQTLIVPCIAASFGNSVALSWIMEDNYSVGPTATKGITPADKTQTYTPYGDEFGRISNMYMIYITKDDYFPQSFFDNELASPYNTLHAQRELEGEVLPNGNREVSTSSGNQNFAVPYSSLYPLAAPRVTVNKDSREKISMTYQLHFQTLSANIILGKALTRNSILVKDYDATKFLKMYVLPTEITKWQTSLDLTDAILIKDFSKDGNIAEGVRGSNSETAATYVKIPEQISTANGKSYVLVENGTNELILGENMSIKKGDTIPQIIFQFTHDID